MAKKVLIKKVSLDEMIDVFVDLYNRGVDYVDLVNAEEEGKLSVVFNKEYMCEEMQDSDEFQRLHNSIVSDVDFDEEDSTFSEHDINDLI
jgi:hypothetical protein